MLYVTFERTVRRRPEIVWTLLTDLSALTTWVEELVEVRVVDEEKLAVGARVAIERRALGKSARATCEITAWREPSLIAIETRLPKVVVLDRITLTSVADGTLLGVFAERSYGTAVSELFTRAPGLSEATSHEAAIRGVYERSIDALVTRIERQSAIPYR